jgi:predicted HTH transcriptional regulator
MQAEFKPFIDPDEGMGTRGKRTKLRELVTTIVAFANTQGGRIFIGINDDCGICGVGQELQRWGKAAVSEDSVERYRGALTSTIRDQLVGDVTTRVSYTFVNGMLVVVVDVEQSPAKPVAVIGDNIFYVRAGASNKQLPPDQWATVLGANNSNAALLLRSAR